MTSPHIAGEYSTRGFSSHGAPADRTQERSRRAMDRRTPSPAAGRTLARIRLAWTMHRLGPTPLWPRLRQVCEVTGSDYARVRWNGRRLRQDPRHANVWDLVVIGAIWRTRLLARDSGLRFPPWGRHLARRETAESAGWKPTPLSALPSVACTAQAQTWQ